jgi:hypothetical protein
VWVLIPLQQTILITIIYDHSDMGYKLNQVTGMIWTSLMTVKQDDRIKCGTGLRNEKNVPGLGKRWVTCVK